MKRFWPTEVGDAHFCEEKSGTAPHNRKGRVLRESGSAFVPGLARVTATDVRQSGKNRIIKLGRCRRRACRNVSIFFEFHAVYYVHSYLEGWKKAAMPVSIG